MFGKIQVFIIMFGLILTYVIQPSEKAQAVAVLSNYSSIQGTGLTMQAGHAYGIEFAVPAGDVDYQLLSLKIRIDCQSVVPCEFDMIPPVGGGFPQATVPASTLGNAVFNLNTTSRIVTPNATKVFTINLSSGTAVWRFASAPTGALTYVRSRDCLGFDCPTITDLSMELDATPLIGAPTLLAPVHLAHVTDTTPQFSWSSVTGSNTFRIYIYNDDRSFEFKKIVTGTNFTVTTPLTPQKYLWRVRAKHVQTGVFGTWSPRRTLFVD